MTHAHAMNDEFDNDHQHHEPEKTQEVSEEYFTWGVVASTLGAIGAGAAAAYQYAQESGVVCAASQMTGVTTGCTCHHHH